MPLHSSKKFIIVETKNKQHKLTAVEYARWLCLIEALDIVTKKAQLFKIDLLNKDVDWVKPLAFQKYITERFESMIEEVNINENLNLPKNIKKQLCTISSEPVLS